MGFTFTADLWTCPRFKGEFRSSSSPWCHGGGRHHKSKTGATMCSCTIPLVIRAIPVACSAIAAQYGFEGEWEGPPTQRIAVPVVLKHPVLLQLQRSNLSQPMCCHHGVQNTSAQKQRTAVFIAPPPGATSRTHCWSAQTLPSRRRCPTGTRKPNVLNTCSAKDKRASTTCRTHN